MDAKLVYDVWLRLISDEELYRAMLDDTHRGLAASRGLGESELEILEKFRSEKGTRWNIENLRFRTALEVSDTLGSYLPRTIRMLTNGDANWLQDISFEYLAFHKWVEYGHHRFAECERFAAYVADRIMKRRVTPAHLDSVLAFELGVVSVLKRTLEVPAEAWSAPRELADAELGQARLRRSPCCDVIALPVDIREWVTSGDPLRGQVRSEPVAFLVYVPSLTDTHRIKILGEGPREVLARFDGSRTTDEAAGELEELGIERTELLALVRNWLVERVLVVAEPT
jgi:hypothetical protein